jgi:hypothetical protein
MRRNGMAGLSMKISDERSMAKTRRIAQLGGSRNGRRPSRADNPVEYREAIPKAE